MRTLSNSRELFVQESSICYIHTFLDPDATRNETFLHNRFFLRTRPKKIVLSLDSHRLTVGRSEVSCPHRHVVFADFPNFQSVMSKRHLDCTVSRQRVFDGQIRVSISSRSEFEVKSHTHTQLFLRVGCQSTRTYTHTYARTKTVSLPFFTKSSIFADELTKRHHFLGYLLTSCEIRYVDDVLLCELASTTHQASVRSEDV